MAEKYIPKDVIFPQEIIPQEYQDLENKILGYSDQLFLSTPNMVPSSGGPSESTESNKSDNNNTKRASPSYLLNTSDIAIGLCGFDLRVGPTEIVRNHNYETPHRIESLIMESKEEKVKEIPWDNGTYIYYRYFELRGNDVIAKYPQARGRCGIFAIYVVSPIRNEFLKNKIEDLTSILKGEEKNKAKLKNEVDKAKKYFREYLLSLSAIFTPEESGKMYNNVNIFEEYKEPTREEIEKQKRITMLKTCIKTLKTDKDKNAYPLFMEAVKETPNIYS